MLFAVHYEVVDIKQIVDNATPPMIGIVCLVFSLPLARFVSSFVDVVLFSPPGVETKALQSTQVEMPASEGGENKNASKAASNIGLPDRNNPPSGRSFLRRMRDGVYHTPRWIRVGVEYIWRNCWMLYRAFFFGGASSERHLTVDDVLLPECEFSRSGQETSS